MAGAYIARARPHHRSHASRIAVAERSNGASKRDAPFDVRSSLDYQK
jgi:hypothetical protein